MYTLKQAASKAGISEELLLLWVSTGRVKPAKSASKVYLPVPNQPHQEREDFSLPAAYAFNDKDLETIRSLAEQPQSKPARATPTAKDIYTVAEVAALLNLSSDTIRRIFIDEPGVISLGDENPRGRRKRVTLRIPKEVVERVKRKRAKK